MPRSLSLNHDELLARQAFQLELFDRLRAAHRPDDIMALAAESLGLHLHTARCGYGDIINHGEVVSVANDWTNGTVPSLAGEARLLDGFGPAIIAELRAGRTLVVEDCRSDARANDPAHLATWDSIATRSLIVCPLLQEGHLQAILYVHEPQPRIWTSAEITLVEDVARRTMDAVDRARAEAALRDNREELELATRVTRLGRFDYRVKEGTLVWDDRCRQLFGLSPGVPVSYEGSYLAGLHPDDRARADAAVAAALDPNSSGTFDIEYRTIGIEDGIERYVSAHGLAFFEGVTPLRLIGAVQDVSDDRRAQLHLRETEERLRLASRATNDAIWDWDFRRNHVLWNEALERAYGYHLAEVTPTGEWWIEHIHPEDRDRIDRSIHRVIDGGGTDWADEYRFLRADGSYADVLDRGYVIREGDGTAVRMIGAMLDQTERNRLVRQLRAEKEGLEEAVVATIADLDRAEEALRHAQKMEAVGQLTGGLAHDFNNLLAGIGGALEMIQVRITQGRINDLERYSTAAQGAVKRAAALTHRLLAFSRRQTLDPKPTDINRLVAGMEELIRRTVGPGINVEVVGAVGLWITMVDPNQLENALLNLSINARDAMPDGGRITIETANKWLDPRAARERDLEPGQYISLCVTDTGVGMTPEIASRAFDPFYTTKPMGEGTGLGLSMIYGFARQSGGQVRIYTEPGQGTTMCIYLPRHYGSDDVRSEEPLGALGGAPQTGSTKTVLVVDDEPTIRMLVIEVLQEMGYTPLEAGDGAAALKVLQSGARIDLLITDVGLPGAMNGRQVADAAVEMMPDLKVLFITGYAENAVIGNGQLAPNMALLTKPFAMDMLATRVRQLLD